MSLISSSFVPRTLLIGLPFLVFVVLASANHFPIPSASSGGFGDDDDESVTAHGDPGVTFEGVDALDGVTSQLAAGEEVTDAQWEALYSAPGYRHYLGDDAPDVEDDRDDFRTLVRLVFSPDEAAAFEEEQDDYEDPSDLDNRAFYALLALKNEREALRQARERFQNADLLTGAYEDVSAFVPPSVSVDTMARPSLSFIIYNLDGRATGGDEIVIDHVFAAKQGTDGLRRFIAHEVHHLVRDQLSNLTRPGPDVAEADVVKTLDQLQAEGVADHIDKPPIVFSDELQQQFEGDTTRAGRWMAQAFDRYAQAFRSEYESTPATLSNIDSLLVRTARAEDRGDQDAVREHAEEIWESIAFAGHPNGFYMASQIEDVRNVIANPFEFVYRYNATVCGSDAEAHCFSDEAIQYLRVLEDRYYG